MMLITIMLILIATQLLGTKLVVYRASYGCHMGHPVQRIVKRTAPGDSLRVAKSDGNRVPYSLW